KLAGLRQGEQPLVPVVEPVLGMLSHFEQRGKRAAAVARDQHPSAVSSRRWIVVLLETLEDKADRAVRPANGRSAHRAALEPLPRNLLPFAPGRAFVGRYGAQ